MLRQTLLGLSVVATVVLASTNLVSAHVVVKPEQVNVGAFQTFTTSVPNETDDSDTTGLRVVLPEGLNYVTPTVKPGWTIDVKKSGEGESAKTTEISWTGGSIPAGQRDDFSFSAQAPEKKTTLAWKSYQTYSDGTVVAWDQTPSATDEEGVKPYSETTVVDDLAETSSSDKSPNNGSNSLPLAFSLIAVVLSAAALLRKK